MFRCCLFAFYVFCFHCCCSTAPSGPPDNITAIALSSSEIQITWDPPPQENRNGPILAYNFTALDSATGNVIISRVVVSTYTLVLYLRPFTFYTFTLSARTSIGFGPEDSVTERTLEDCKSLHMLQINDV